MQSTAAADDAAKPAEDYPLPEIVVTAKKTSASRNLSRTIERETFRSWNAHTAAEVLVQTPGVNVQYGGSSGDARIWMRGFRDRDILVLFDGIPIATAFEGNIDLNEISLEAVTDVRVTKSAPSVIYGPNGMGGVVDVVPNPARWKNAFSGAVEVGGNDTQRITGGYTQTGDRISYRVSGSYDHRDAFTLSDDFNRGINQPGKRRTNSDYERYSVFGYARVNSRLLGESSFFYNRSDNTRGLAPEVGVDDADFERLARSDRQTLGVSNRFERLPVSIKLFHNRYESELEVYTDKGYSELDDLERADEESWGAMAYSSVAAGKRHLLVMGASALRERYQGDGALESFDSATLKTYSVSAEDHVALGPVSLIVGGILSHFDQPEDGRSITLFNPQIVVDWQVTQRLTLHASAAERTRFPKLRELYQRRRGNPDLAEQQARNYQVGVAYDHGAFWSADLTFFHSDVDGLIERPDRRSTFQNLPELEFRGAEISTSLWPTARVSGRLAYTYLEAREPAPDGGSRQLRSRAKHSVYGELRVNLAHDVALSLNGIYSDGLYDLDAQQNHVEVGSYVLFHAKAEKRFGDNASAYLSVANLTDTDYAHRLGYPRPGREIRFGVTFSL